MTRSDDGDQASKTGGAPGVVLRWCREGLVRCVLGLVLLPLTLVLSACGPGESRVTELTRGTPSTLARSLDEIDRLGVARPQDQIRPLLALSQQTAPYSADQLRAITLRGFYAALAQDKAAENEALRELDAWPAGAFRDDALLAKAMVQAREECSFGYQERAIRLLQQPALLERSQLEPWLRWRVLQLLGQMLTDVGHSVEASTLVRQALKLAQTSGRTWQQVVSLRDQAWLYYTSDQIEEARRTIEAALKLAQSDPDPVSLQMVQTMRYIVFPDDSSTSIAQAAAEDALQQAKLAHSDGLQALSLANLSDLHLHRGNYLRALDLAEQARPLAKASHRPSIEVLALHNGGLAKIALGQVDEGYRLVLDAIHRNELQGDQAQAADGWLELGTYLERAERWPEALQAYKKYRLMIDVVRQGDVRRALLDAQERYDAEQRTQEIELLNRDNRLKEEQIKAHDLRLWLGVALTGCLVLLGALLWLAYQRTRKANLALAHSNDKLKVQSERDPLTGLANRRHFQGAIKRLAQGGRLSGTVFLIDIDHFKRINDVHGHAAGDAVLIAVAQRLRSALREDDLVVRWGGEEFLIVVKTRDADLAQGLAQRLLDLIALPPVRHGERDITVTASIGFASFPLAPHDLALEWERAIDLVDTVMYLAKAHGRNKAYGVVAIEARSQAEVNALSARMDEACGDGVVTLVALQGPPQFEASRQ